MLFASLHISGPVWINQAFTRLVSDASLVTEPQRDGAASLPAAVGCSDIWSTPLSDLSWLISTGLPWNVNKMSLERLSEGCRSVSERGDYGWNCSPDLRLLPLSTVAAAFFSDLVSPVHYNRTCIVCPLPSREGKSQHTAALSAAAFKKNPPHLIQISA